MKAFITIFATIFLAELGDKTQLATLLFASDGAQPRWVVFTAAAFALIAATAIAVLLGGAVEKWLSQWPLKLLAGLGFIAIGVLLIVEHANTA